MVLRGGVYQVGGYAGTGVPMSGPKAGCTDDITLSGSGSVTVKVYSMGKPDGVPVYAYEKQSGMMKSCGLYEEPGAAVSGNEVPIWVDPIDDDASKAFMAYDAAAFSIYRHNGKLSSSDATYINLVDENDSGFQVVTSQFSTPNIVYLREDIVDMKGTIAHEVGHRVAYDVRTTTHTAGDVSYHGTMCTNPICKSPSTNTHSAGSKEYVGGAMNEGFAEYYRASVWNNRGADCWLVHDTSNVFDCDCPTCSGDYGRGILNDECGTGCSGFSGYGVELDWARIFWHVDQAACGATQSTILDVFEDADTWTRTSAFRMIDTEFNQRPTAVKNCWNTAVGFPSPGHKIDYSY
jgi:hypothetical protein